MGRPPLTKGLLTGVHHPRGLLVHYMLVVTLVLGLLAGGAVLDQQNVNRATQDDRALVLLAHQMHLSQQILVLAGQLHTPADPDPAEIAALVARLDAAKADVLAIALEIPGGVPEARALAAEISTFVSLARSVLAMPPGSPEAEATLAGLNEIAIAGLPHSLEAQTAVIQDDAERNRAAIGRHDIQILAIVAAILFLEAAFVFWPSYRKAIASVDRLTSKNDAIKEQNRQLEESAHIDPLTGLTNRKRLHDFLDDALAGDAPKDRTLCVLHVDLDHFKELNDTFGHATGDAALKRVAEIMLAHVRKSDVVARIGGDEFVIAMLLSPMATPETVQDISERLIAKIREPMVLNGADIRLGASIGYAFADDGANTPDALIARADVALYEVKRAGKGAARVFSFEMQAREAHRNAMAADMERALDAGEFVPFFQPIVSLETGGVAGVEMLSRWSHPERGLLPPEAFMEIADEVGLIDAIEARVLLDGLDGLAMLRQQGFTIPPLSLSASARSMRYEDFAERLTDAVQAREFRPEQIVVEVLEATLFDTAPDQSSATVGKLRGLGYKVSVSRFGAGHSSLPGLRALDVTCLKTDRSLISRDGAGAEREILSAVLGIASAMALHLVVDGVETDTQVADLRALGAGAAQGAAIARPMGLDALRVWLVEQGFGQDLARGA